MTAMLDISKHANKFIDKLKSKQYKQIASKIFSLSNNPLPTDSKQIVSRLGYFRVDSGEYRIVYTVQKSTIRIELVGKRNDDEFYEELDRLFR
jgi:mRNA interferase RelE/StbE